MILVPLLDLIYTKLDVCTLLANYVHNIFKIHDLSFSLEIDVIAKSGPGPHAAIRRPVAQCHTDLRGCVLRIISRRVCAFNIMP